MDERGVPGFVPLRIVRKEEGVCRASPGKDKEERKEGGDVCGLRPQKRKERKGYVWAGFARQRERNKRERSGPKGRILKIPLSFGKKKVEQRKPVPGAFGAWV